jgi:hypothetical protein
MSLYKYKNSKVWWIDFIFDGVRIRESTKTKSKKLAEEIERKRRSDLESGRMGLNKRERPRLFSLVAEDYLQVKQPVLSDRGLIIEKSNLKHLLLVFGGKLLSDIGAAEIGVYQRDRLSAGAAPKTINLEIGTLRAILLRHQLWQFVKQDFRMLKVEESVGKALTSNEEVELLEACTDSRSRTLYPAVVLALNTGMRSIEIRSLRWTQVDLAAKLVRVGRSKTDAGAGRMIHSTLVQRSFCEIGPQTSLRAAPKTTSFRQSVMVKAVHHTQSIRENLWAALRRVGRPHANVRRSSVGSMISGTRPAPVCSKVECPSLCLHKSWDGARPRRSRWPSDTATSGTALCGRPWLCLTRKSLEIGEDWEARRGKCQTNHDREITRVGDILWRENHLCD